ncbi:MAG: hypothetical protein R6W70_04670 [bacterium]
MKTEQYQSFKKLVSDFERYVETCKNDELHNFLQKNNIGYSVENEVVFNTRLSSISKKDNIKFIVVGDNPGKDEQLDRNRYYLMGKAGVQMRNFFSRHDFVTDFDREVVVLNKTPFHTKSTSDIKNLLKFRGLIDDSQRYMASLAAEMHRLFRCPLWIIGFSQMKKNGIFRVFREELEKQYSSAGAELKNSLLFFKHFSYGNFSRDISEAERVCGDKHISSLLKYTSEKNRKCFPGF